ncbi:hypothetical protein Zmor_018440 [Zophobas morio]|uniref:Reverse transcriptase domain-containing protein n=1 Tax=Zophobas morio TaxID=2755281 RepID=A0AA38MDY2_9CUCU|nr:hypothetical protein Zmor_018440 [Zophobas morio]
MALKNTIGRVKVQGKTSDSFNVKQELREGDPVNNSMRSDAREYYKESDIKRKGLLFNRSHQCQTYADDLVLLARNRKELEKITAKLMREAEEICLEFNIEKTKYVELKNNCGSRDKNNVHIDRQEGLKVDLKK